MRVCVFCDAPCADRYYCSHIDEHPQLCVDCGVPDSEWHRLGRDGARRWLTATPEERETFQALRALRR